MDIAAAECNGGPGTKSSTSAMNNHRSVLANFLAAAVFFLPNLLLFVPAIRQGAWWIVMAFNGVMMFLLISAVSHVKFKN